MTTMKLGLLFGGRSGEHEISVMSARSIFNAAVQGGCEVTGIGITRAGKWVFLEDVAGFFASGPSEVTLDLGPPCWIVPGQERKGLWIDKGSSGAGFGRTFRQIDVVFPALHGPFGEDGSVQGLLELAGIPYVGAPPMASAVCMDKDTTKRLLSAHGVPYVPALAVNLYEWRTNRDSLLGSLLPAVSYPAFVKPSGSGSSLGVNKIKGSHALPEALDEAFLYDYKALIEPSQEGCIEVECSVLGNDEPEVSVVGQILPAREFYDYEAKYLDQGTRLVIPAPLDRDFQTRIGEIAIAGFKATGCKGMARVDFFVDVCRQEAYIGEINTIPGFTSISMYPKLWEASGLSYTALIRTLVQLAIERHGSSHREVRRKGTQPRQCSGSD